MPRKGRFSTNEREGGNVDRDGTLIKELAPTLLSRQTRADTRLPGDICGRSSSLAPSRRQIRRGLLFATTMTNVTTIHCYMCPGLRRRRRRHGHNARRRFYEAR
jgi:hypothetical protein